MRLWNIRACCLQREFIGLSGPRLSGLTCNPIVSILTRSLIGWERVRPTPDWLSSVVGGAGRQLNGSKISSTQCQQARRHRTPELSYFASSQGRETERETVPCGYGDLTTLSFLVQLNILTYQLLVVGVKYCNGSVLASPASVIFTLLALESVLVMLTSVITPTTRCPVKCGWQKSTGVDSLSRELVQHNITY